MYIQQKMPLFKRMKKPIVFRRQCNVLDYLLNSYSELVGVHQGEGRLEVEMGIEILLNERFF